MPTPEAFAEAFSGHRFADAYDQLADDVDWVIPGQPGVTGRAAVVETCEQTLAALAQTRMETLRFLVVPGPTAVAVDSVTRYTDPDGSVSVVSSSDFYEFRDGLVVGITSYAVELDPDAPDPALGSG